MAAASFPLQVLDCCSMGLSFAAVFFRAQEVGEAALRRGFAVSTAGYDLAAPSLSLSELPGAPGWSVAFFSSGISRGAAGSAEELDLAAELFEDELPPGLAVREQAGIESAVVHSLVYTEDLLLDDAASFSASGLKRRFVREGDEGPEAGAQDDDETKLEPLDELDDDAAFERLVAPHRGSSYLAAELGVRILPAVAQALYLAERKLTVRLADPEPTAIEELTAALVESLHRKRGRAAFDAFPELGGVQAPPSYRAFVRVYDFEDPSDPADLYRGLAIGGVEGTLRFFRRAELEAFASREGWPSGPAERGLYPIASLRTDALGGAARAPRVLALMPDGDALRIVDDAGRDVEAGPRFGELLLYLSLGFRSRDDAEEDLIEATMLRAQVRRT
jgi:hypothetical protein